MSSASDTTATTAAVIPFRPRQRAFQCVVSDTERLHLLAIRRADWNRLHPEASPEEVDAAHAEIAKGLGL